VSRGEGTGMHVQHQANWCPNEAVARGGVTSVEGTGMFMCSTAVQVSVS
jgi:hypothetical protein